MRAHGVVAHQTWESLTFAHWRAPTELLRDLVPRDVTLDAFDGSGWLSLVPFRCRAFRPAFVPRALGLRFVECNVRTYVRWRGEPAIWLLSADVSSSLAASAYSVLLGGAARRASLRLHDGNTRDGVTLSAHRGGTPAASLSFNAQRSTERTSIADELDRFLLDRFLQVSMRGGTLWGVRVRHVPIQPMRCAVDVRDHGWSEPMRIPRFANAAERAHHARRVDVDIELPMRLDAHRAMRVMRSQT
jgi:uncharacterized protein